MAATLEQILAELGNVYDPQARAVQGQMDQLPAYYQGQRQGLDTAKTNAFGDIVRGANARGVVYSGAPIQEEQRYVGSTYLPALAGLAHDEQQQRFQLTSALNDLNSRRYSQAYDIRQKQMDTEAAERKAAADRSALFNAYNGANQRQPEPQVDKWQVATRGMANQTNPYVWHDYLRDVNQQVFGGKATYGQLAGYIEGHLGAKIGSGSAPDLALRNLFLKTELDPRRATVNSISRAAGGGAW